MLKKISVIVVVAMLGVSPAYANEAPKITDVAKGQKVPFAGTLLNPAAAAQLIAEKENVKEQCSLSKSYIENKEKARCDLLINTANARLDASKSTLDAILAIKDEEIARLNGLALEQPNKYNHWWFAGGIAAGIITSVVIFYAAVEISHE
ncbi:MAG: hypothetical protein CL398_01180 [Acidiferrobacteraceae bacterium]|mgnify:FL=1|nr:hypothetical protein [Acidiferrobacteraceae bacterium]